MRQLLGRAGSPTRYPNNKGKKRPWVLLGIACIQVAAMFLMAVPLVQPVSADDCDWGICIINPPPAPRPPGSPPGGGTGGGEGNGGSTPGGGVGGGNGGGTGGGNGGGPEIGNGPPCGALAAAGLPCEAQPPTAGAPAPPPPPPPPIPVDGPGEAAKLCAQLGLPDVTLDYNPSLAMVNVATWFYAQGYRGQFLYINKSWTAPYVPTTIEIEGRPVRYLWNFGDGGQVETTTLPAAYPAESAVRNAYQWSSKTEPGGYFHTSLTIVWDGYYRVNGGPWQFIATRTRSYSGLLPVQQLQPIIRP